MHVVWSGINLLNSKKKYGRPNRVFLEVIGSKAESKKAKTPQNHLRDNEDNPELGLVDTLIELGQVFSRPI